MKAVILAGGEGTRLRPLTLSAPKPVVPVVDRPFLRHQLDLLASAGVREVVFSVAYRPERIQAVFGDGSAFGFKIHYAFEESPLGTGGAVKNAEPFLDERTVVLNGDVLCDLDLSAVVATHVARQASASIVLAPVPNPAAFGLVETDADMRVRRFLEKPTPEEITTNTINAGVYVLETRVLELVPPGVVHSIERGFFPALLARGDLVLGPVHRGYWIDIGTPEKYRRVHRDILSGAFSVSLDGERRAAGWVHATASVDAAAELVAPFYIGPQCVVDAEARVGPWSVLVEGVEVGARARVEDSVLWAGCLVEPEATVTGALFGPSVRVGASASVKDAVLGEGTFVTEYSRTA
jgi:NDP-sugar pyrophosphorylase family protein